MSDRFLHQHKGFTLVSKDDERGLEAYTTPDAPSPIYKSISDPESRHPLVCADSMSTFGGGGKTAATLGGSDDRRVDLIDESQLSNPFSASDRKNRQSKNQPHTHKELPDSFDQRFTYTKEPQPDKMLSTSVHKRSAPVDEPGVRSTRTRIDKLPAGSATVAGDKGHHLSAGLDEETIEGPASIEKSQHHGKRVKTGETPTNMAIAPVTYGARTVKNLIFYDDPAGLAAAEKFFRARKKVVHNRSLFWQVSHLPDDVGPDGPERWDPPFDVTQVPWPERSHTASTVAENGTAPIIQHSRGSTFLERATSSFKGFRAYHGNFVDISSQAAIVHKHHAEGHKFEDKNSEDAVPLAPSSARGSVQVTKGYYRGNHPGKQVFSASKAEQAMKITKPDSPTEQPPSLLTPQKNHVDSSSKRSSTSFGVLLMGSTKNKTDGRSGTKDAAASASSSSSISRGKNKRPTPEENAAMLIAYLNNWSYPQMSREGSFSYDQVQIKQHFMYLVRTDRVGPRHERANGGRRWVTLEWMRKYQVQGDWEERDGKAWAVDVEVRD
ncbi:hypothetical protein SLS60_005873 [Paraconiothyrium brasiliense]|uniref:Uncharacterized protein n=1 Tax=Paraconiothyrium brasiliense TaxID=300254 RepID=A0ABR3REZ6_9PLEO